MKVYMVLHNEPYEGASIYGLFSSKAKAKRYIKRENWRNELEVEEWTIDEELKEEEYQLDWTSSNSLHVFESKAFVGMFRLTCLTPIDKSITPTNTLTISFLDTPMFSEEKEMKIEDAKFYLEEKFFELKDDLESSLSEA